MLKISKMLSGAMIIAFLIGLNTGCPFPIPLSADPPLQNVDAGPSSPPVIVGAQPTKFSIPGPFLLSRSENPELSLTIEDTDHDDTIFVQFYVDYNLERDRSNQPIPTPARASCEIGASGTRARVGVCNMTTLCIGIDGADTSRHLVEAVVSDRDFLNESERPENQPPFRGLPSDAASSTQTWLFECEPEVAQ